MLQNLPPIEELQVALSTNLMLQLIGTGAIIAVLMVLHRLVGRIIERNIEAVDKQSLLRQVSKYVAGAVGILLLGPLWIDRVSPIFTVLSLVAAALTIVNKELILNLTAWPVINWRRLFNPGDRVQVGTQVGDVVDLGVLYFTLTEVGTGAEAEQFTGRVTKVPNSAVFTQPVTNYSRSLNYVWHQITLALTPESDWQAAEALAQETAAQHVRSLNPADQKRIQRSDEAPVYAAKSPLAFTQVQDGKRVVILRYLCRPRRRAETERVVWAALLQALAEREDIKLALS